MVMLNSMLISTKSHSQVADSSRGFQAYGHIAGMVTQGTRYGIVLRLYKDLNVDISYGNVLLDYLGLSLSGLTHSYGMGLLYSHPLKKTRVLYLSVGINNFFYKYIDPTIIPAKMIKSHPFVGLTICTKSGFTAHIRSGILVDIWNDHHNFNILHFKVWPFGLFETGIGYTLKLHKK